MSMRSEVDRVFKAGDNDKLSEIAWEAAQELQKVSQKCIGKIGDVMRRREFVDTPQIDEAWRSVGRAGEEQWRAWNKLIDANRFSGRQTWPQ